MSEQIKIGDRGEIWKHVVAKEFEEQCIVMNVCMTQKTADEIREKGVMM